MGVWRVLGGVQGFFWFVGLGFFPLRSCLLPFRDFFGMIALEWFWKEKQLFTSHWTVCSQELGQGQAPWNRQSPNPTVPWFGTHIPANVLQTWP